MIKHRLIIFSLLLVLITACVQTGDTITASLGQEFTLQVGQSAQIRNEDLEMRFERVTGDSRCPKGVQCIWAGEVSCELQLKDRESTSTLQITESGQTDTDRQVTHKNYKILYHIQPYPEAGKKISDEEYRLILKVEK